MQIIKFMTEEARLDWIWAFDWVWVVAGLVMVTIYLIVLFHVCNGNRN
jgi:hypothetical protein